VAQIQGGQKATIKNDQLIILKTSSEARFFFYSDYKMSTKMLKCLH